MSEAGGKRGLKAYLATLVATVLFPILWMQALRLARRHEDVDPRARAKVVVAIAASLAIALVGTYALLGFFAAAEDGMYKSMDARLAQAVGETEYQDQVSIITTSQDLIPKVELNIPKAERDLANATALNQSAPNKANAEAVVKARTKVNELHATLDKTREELAAAQARKAELEDNHRAYDGMHDALAAKDDDELRALIAQAPAYEDKDERAAEAFAIKDQSLSDMRLMGWLFFWPSLVGAFFAPLVFALGSILRKAFVPSDTVGFKPYPGAAAGWFLLFGAFGLPSIPFAAWTFNDAMGRSEEGQISL